MYSVTITLAKLVCLHGDDMILELRVIFVVAYIFIFSILPFFFLFVLGSKYRFVLLFANSVIMT